MGVAGIICEYNPFHPGHRYQIEALRRRLGPTAAVVCLMSGNYVQRGEPAIYDKWTRAKSALGGGADLVLELPLTAAVNAAGYFAAGAVDCLSALGCCEYLCFGTEAAEGPELLSAAKMMQDPAFEDAVHQALRGGVSYPRAREQALEALGGRGQLLRTPNNALGIDYLRRLLETGGGMEPLAIPRRADLPSASDLRAALSGTREGPPVHTLYNGERAMLGVLRTLPESAFRSAPFGSEGLWSKVMKACRRESTVEAILGACKSKRYTHSRLRRMLLCLFLGLEAADLARPIPYLRVLGFNDRGREVLHRAKSTSALPLVSGQVPGDPAAQGYFALESRATDLYGLFAPPGTVEPTGREKWQVAAVETEMKK